MSERHRTAVQYGMRIDRSSTDCGGGVCTLTDTESYSHLDGGNRFYFFFGKHTPKFAVALNFERVCAVFFVGLMLRITEVLY